MATRLDPIEYLERDDKWYLGGGAGIQFAPPFPRFLSAPGFWDEAYFVDVRLDRLFTLFVLDEEGRPCPFEPARRRWTPDALTHIRATPDGLRLREDKVLTPANTFGSRLTLHNDGKRSRSLHLVLWSLQERNEFLPGQRVTSAEQIELIGPAVVFSHVVQYGNEPYADRPAENAGWGEIVRPALVARRHALHIALGSERLPASHWVGMSERADTKPDWRISPILEKFREGALTNEFHPDGIDGSARNGHLHICLHYPVTVPVGQSVSLQFGASVALDRAAAAGNLTRDLGQDLARHARQDYAAYFEQLPYFECSDEYIQRSYWYRWYGMRLNTVSIGGHRIEGEEGIRFPYPVVFEGIGGFRSHISFSAQCHAREAVWMHDATLARGCIEGLFIAQEHSGYLPGHLYLWRHTRGFYHADWGAAVLQVHRVTGDLGFVDRLYPALSRYAEYFERDRDREDMHLYDVVDQGETGQEYSSRYLFADASADDWRRIQLKGVDATVYVYRLQRALEEMARLLGKPDEADVWARKADSTRDAVRKFMWDPEQRFFVDVDPKTGARSPYRAATGLYPFLCDIATREHLPAITEHLLNPQEFWTTWPVPTSPLSDPFFNADAEWRGYRHSCPWNGRVWPMANSHVCDALANAARTLEPSLAPAAADLLLRALHLLFHDGDPVRPNCYEHYNPFTGAPSAYRGVDDYMHSWVVDLIVRHLVGLQPSSNEQLVLDPLPVPVERFAMYDLRYRGRRLDVLWSEREGYAVFVDGAEITRQPERCRLELTLP